MKKIILALLLSLPLLAYQARAQDVDINVLTIPPSLEKDKTGVILVTLCNGDASPIDAPAAKLRPLISVNPIVEITGVTNTDGSPLSGWSVLNQSASSVRLLNTAPLVNGECISFHVQIKAVTVSTVKVVTATLGFNGPQTNGNNTANDNSTTGIAVTEPLPVTLTSFTAVKENSTALLNWATTMETNSDRFEIERSLNGKNWNKIGSVTSNGESNIKRDYSFKDAEPLNGENLYRLKMVDKDATFAYSRIQSLSFEGLNKDLSVYPNPTVDVLRIRDYSQVTKVTINDMNGRTVLESGMGKSGEISVRNLASGMYLVKISRSNGLTSSHKIVVGK